MRVLTGETLDMNRMMFAKASRLNITHMSSHAFHESGAFTEAELESVDAKGNGALHYAAMNRDREALAADACTRRVLMARHAPSNY